MSFMHTHNWFHLALFHLSQSNHSEVPPPTALLHLLNLFAIKIHIRPLISLFSLFSLSFSSLSYLSFFRSFLRQIESIYYPHIFLTDEAQQQVQSLASHTRHTHDTHTTHTHDTTRHASSLTVRACAVVARVS
jgi:hypothetical protein